MHVAEVFFYLAVFLSAVLVPYSLIALRAYEGNRRVRAVQRDPSHPLQPAFGLIRLLTKINLWGTAFVISVSMLTVWAQVEENVHPLPAWGLALSMLRTCVLLVILWAPSTALIRLKYRAMGKRIFPPRFARGKRA